MADVLVLHRSVHRLDPEALGDEIEARTALDVAVAESHRDALDRIADVEVVAGVFLPDDLLAAAGELGWFQALSAGTDHLPTDRLRERGVVLTNAAGVHAEPVAEQVFGYLLVFERNLDRAIEQARRHEYQHIQGGELAGKTLGIVGVGEIGTRIAELGSAFDMRVVGVKRRPEEAPDVLDAAYGPDELHRVVGRADYLVLACPLTDETEHLIGATELASMKTDAVLVNVARGPVVDESALVDALQQRTIAGAALDVFETEPLPPDSPLWDLSNALLTPHTGGGTPHYWARCAEIVAENHEHYAGGDRDRMVNRLF